jgi:hypothetical protein
MDRCNCGAGDDAAEVDMAAVARRLWAALHDRDLSLGGLGRAANLGPEIAEVLLGARPVSSVELALMAGYLQVPMEWLLAGPLYEGEAAAPPPGAVPGVEVKQGCVPPPRPDEPAADAGARPYRVDPTGSFDARVWAEAFAETIARHPEIPADRETMHTWFANVLMAGYDEARRQDPNRASYEAAVQELHGRIGELAALETRWRRKNSVLLDAERDLLRRVAELEAQVVEVRRQSTAEPWDPAVGDRVVLYVQIVGFDEDGAQVRLYRSWPLDQTVVMQPGALDHDDWASNPGATPAATRAETERRHGG